MMYKDKFVVAVKSQDGKILREDGDIVYLPYTEEYSLQFKNLNNQKAVITVEIDGQDVLDGSKLIINAGDSINLERFITSLDSGNKFKFIQKTQEIQEHRGDKIDDGFIRVTFQFEKPVQPRPPLYFNSSITTTLGNGTCTNTSGTFRKGGQYTNSTGKSPLRGTDDNASMQSFNASSAKFSSRGLDNTVSTDSLGTFDSFVPKQDEGITVKGSKSSQTFRQGYVGALETELHTLVLRVKGFTRSGEVVIAPLTVNTKLTCSSCGKVSDSTNEFCGKCGTALM